MAANKCTLSWSDHHSVVTSYVAIFLEENSLTDCTLAAEGYQIQAHKIVLSACSPYLKMLLCEAYDPHPIIIFQDIKFQDLMTFMDFVYKGEIQIPEGRVGYLLEIVETLQMGNVVVMEMQDGGDIGAEEFNEDLGDCMDVESALETVVNSAGEDQAGVSALEGTWKAQTSGGSTGHCSESTPDADGDTCEEIYQCSECQKRFTTKRKLKLHMRVHKGEEPYQCSECQKRFATKSQLKKHMRVHTAEKPYKCTEYHKIFSTKHHLSVHVRKHTGEKPYQCSECQKRFTTKGDLHKPMRVTTPEKPYQCSECQRRFTIKGNLDKHMRGHTGVKPYECLACQKRFTTKQQLSVHVRVHTGEKPYQCSECQKKFSTKQQLCVHMRIHTKEKPYQCSECQKRFLTKQHLLEHMRVHAREKLYKCSECQEI